MIGTNKKPGIPRGTPGFLSVLLNLSLVEVGFTGVDLGRPVRSTTWLIFSRRLGVRGGNPTLIYVT